MNSWVLKNIRYLSEGSKQSDNMGQLPKSAKYNRTFLNIETGECREITDLQSKIYKRDNYMKLFFGVYSKYFLMESLSLLSAVVNQEEYPTITKFVNTLTHKLKRKGITRLGYVWVRDVGDEIFHKHYHIIIATGRINEQIFNDMFRHKKHNDYDIQFVKTPKGISKYITDKDLFGADKQRTYGKSRHFPILKECNPKLNHIENKLIRI
jgi:hypothetical protein